MMISTRKRSINWAPAPVSIEADREIAGQLMNTTVGLSHEHKLMIGSAPEDASLRGQGQTQPAKSRTAIFFNYREVYELIVLCGHSSPASFLYIRRPP